MRLHQLIRRARIAAIAAVIIAISVSAFGQTGQSRFSSSLQQAAAQAAAQPPAESVRRALDRRGGQAGARAEPRHPDPALRPADSGHRRRAGAIVLGAATARPASPGTRRRSSRPTSFAGSGASIAQPAVLQPASVVNQTLPWGAQLHRHLEQRAVHDQRTCSAASTRSSARTCNLQYTQPLLRNFEIDQIRQQVANSKKIRELSDIQLDGVITQTLRNVQERVLGSVVRDQQPEGAAAVAGAGAAVAAATTRSASRSARWRRSTSCRRRPKSRATRSA